MHLLMIAFAAIYPVLYRPKQGFTTTRPRFPRQEVRDESLTGQLPPVAVGACLVVEVWLPYGRSEIPVRVPEERLVDILRPDSANSLTDPIKEAAELLKSNEVFLSKAAEAKSICIALGSCGNQQLTNDLTRAVRECVSNGQVSVTILCTDESLQPNTNSVGASRILRHTGKSDTLAYGPPCEGFTPQVNAEFVKADLKVVIGELRPHQFLKYAGLCDLVFPGLSSAASGRAESEQVGVTFDSIHMRRIETAKALGNLFALGLILNSELRATAVIFDGIENCLRALEPIVDNAYSKQATKRAEIVVMSSGGVPFDVTLARAVEAFPTGLNALRKEGALIVAAECGEGHGGGQFYEWSAEGKEPRYLESRLRHHFNYSGFKASFLGRILQTHRVYLVSTIPDHYVETIFSMKPAATVNAALQSAQRALGSDSTISVIPNGCRVITKQPESI